ncbi:MAG TPA: peptidylprolyl isomerase [Vicinamibacterales bacterium]|nr:peptidylprolyl isomerase [Vicinamibacterales bacterium]
MKRVLSVALFVALAAACKKAPPPAAATTAAPGAPAGAAAPGTPPAAAKPLPAQLPNVIAKVNGESVERWELETAIKGVEGRAGSPIPTDRHDEIVRGLIDQLVAFHVLSQEAHARKLDPTDTDVQVRIGQFKGSFPDEKAFEQAVTAQGMTLEQLQKQTRMGLEVSKVLDSEVNSKIAVADADVEGFYNQNTERFKQGETVHASHILIAVPQGADAATKSAARAKATQVLKQVKAGGDFASLAKANSQDGSAQNGGDLGFFPKGQMEPTFEKTAFALKPGTTSGLVETPFGFHIIKVFERRPPRTAPLAEVAPQIKEFLTGQQRQTKIAAFVDHAKAKSKIEILV